MILQRYNQTKLLSYDVVSTISNGNVDIIVPRRGIICYELRAVNIKALLLHAPHRTGIKYLSLRSWLFIVQPKECKCVSKLRRNSTYM